MIKTLYNLLSLCFVLAIAAYVGYFVVGYLELRPEVEVKVPAPGTTLAEGKIYINEHTIYVEIADTPDRRALGLMERYHLQQNRGMLFVFDAPGMYSFWMKNTKIPLDIAWINESYEIIHIEHLVAPCGILNCPSYVSSEPAKYVLELNGGWFKQNNVGVGQRLIFAL